MTTIFLASAPAGWTARSDCSKVIAAAGFLARITRAICKAVFPVEEFVIARTSSIDSTQPPPVMRTLILFPKSLSKSQRLLGVRAGGQRRRLRKQDGPCQAPKFLRPSRAKFARIFAWPDAKACSNSSRARPQRALQNCWPRTKRPKGCRRFPRQTC